jgi:hypothetical protein
MEQHLSDQLSSGMHIPALFIIDQIRSYKKEDKHIIQQKLANHTKVFLNESSFQDFNYGKKCILTKVGIPTHKLEVSNSFDSRNDVAIMNYGPIANQLKVALEENGLSCTLVDAKNNIETLNYLFNRYKICIDLSDNYKINLLCAMCCGCKTITTKNNPVFCPFTSHIDLNDNIIPIIKDLCTNSPDTKAYIEYIQEQYPFDSFNTTIKQIINNISHEVYIK